MSPKRKSPRKPKEEKRIENGRTVYSIRDPNELTRIVDWLKFKYSAGQFVYRGQAGIFADIAASGFRDLGAKGQATLTKHLVQYIDALADGPCTCPSGPFHYGQAHSA